VSKRQVIRGIQLLVKRGHLRVARRHKRRGNLTFPRYRRNLTDGTFEVTEQPPTVGFEVTSMSPQKPSMSPPTTIHVTSNGDPCHLQSEKTDTLPRLTVRAVLANLRFNQERESLVSGHLPKDGSPASDEAPRRLSDEEVARLEAEIEANCTGISNAA